VSRCGSYIVRFSGLSEGEHDYSFELDKKFFASFEQTEIEQGKVHAALVLEKEAGIMVLHIHLKGEVEVICDRCLDPFMTPIQSDQHLILKRGDTPGEIEDDVIVIGKEDHEIDVKQYLYEYVMLALPYKRIHPFDENGMSTCNPRMIEKLEAHQERKDDQKNHPDPRWNALKEIIEKNN